MQTLPPNPKTVKSQKLLLSSLRDPPLDTEEQTVNNE